MKTQLLTVLALCATSTAFAGVPKTKVEGLAKPSVQTERSYADWANRYPQYAGRAFMQPPSSNMTRSTKSGGIAKKTVKVDSGKFDAALKIARDKISSGFGLSVVGGGGWLERADLTHDLNMRFSQLELTLGRVTRAKSYIVKFDKWGDPTGEVIAE